MNIIATIIIIIIIFGLVFRSAINTPSGRNFENYSVMSLMIGLIFVIDFLIIFILISKIIKHNSKVKYERYENILPYKYMWNIYSCYSIPCTLKKSYNCYKWCNNWKEPSAREECRVNCLNIGDIQSDVIKFNDYTWSIIQPKLTKYSIINKNSDYV